MNSDEFRGRQFSSLASGKKSSLSFSLMKEIFHQIDSDLVYILIDEINKILLSKDMKLVLFQRDQERCFWSTLHR